MSEDLGDALQARASHEPSPAVSAVPVAIAIAGAAAIWRNGVGTTIEAVDRVRSFMNKTTPRRQKSKAYRLLDDLLDEVLQLVSDQSRQIFKCDYYRDANEQCRRVQARVAQAIEARQGQDAERLDRNDESAVRQDAPETPDSSGA